MPSPVNVQPVAPRPELLTWVSVPLRSMYASPAPPLPPVGSTAGAGPALNAATNAPLKLDSTASPPESRPKT